MSQATRDYERWSELMDRQAAGETLDVEELAFCAQMVEANEACRREEALLDELAELDGTPTERTRALVESTLARLEAEGQIAPAPVQRSLLAATRRRTALLWGGASIAAAAAAMLGVSWPQPSEAPSARQAATPAPQRVELVYASGSVRVDGHDVGGEGAMLAEGSRIEVAEGSACIAMDPGIDVCLDADSQLILSRVHGASRKLDLGRGRVGVRLDTQPEGMRLSIVADGVWSTAIGTAFTVERQAGEAVSTTVLHGKVRVGGGESAAQVVGAHQRAQVQDGQAKLSAVSRSEESPEWALLGPAELWRSPVSATLELRGVPIGASVRLDGRPIGIAPLSTLVPAGNHRVAILVDGTLVMRRDFTAAAGQRAVVHFVPMAPPEARQAEPLEGPIEPPAPAKRSRAQAQHEPLQAATPPSAADMLQDARGLMRQARWQDAADSYQALRERHPGSHEARTVLVPLAQLELDQLARPGSALRRADAYLAGGTGPLAQEARYTRILALRALGRVEQEGEAIEEYLRLHPQSFQAPALRTRLGKLLSER